MTSRALSIEGLTHRYRSRTALRDVSLDVAPGTVHALVGPSGGGKSTLLRLVAGLLEVQAGRIRIGGVVVAEPGTIVPPESRPVGMVFQDFALFPHLDVHRNVRFGIEGRPDAGRRTRELLSLVGMDDYGDAMPHTLSGGQQQRVALARALARDPAVMLLDEPFSGLDTSLRSDVRSATLSILRARDVATLLVTHDPEEALVVAGSISVLADGTILQSGPAERVYRDPTNRFVAEWFGPVNRIGSRFVRPERIAILRAPAPGARPATIRERTCAGSVVRLRVELDDGTSYTACVLSGESHGIGDRVFILVSD